MRKFVLVAGAVSLLALSGCAYDDYYGDDYYGPGYYGGYGYYYGPGYYDPYYAGPDWYYDGSYYFYYDRHSHNWYRRDRDGRGEHRRDPNWGRNHNWHGDRNAPWNRQGSNSRPPAAAPQGDRRFEGDRGGDYRRRHDRPNSGNQSGTPRPLASPQSPPPPSSQGGNDDSDRPHRWRDRNHDHR
jgi:hypothetical protein